MGLEHVLLSGKPWVELLLGLILTDAVRGSGSAETDDEDPTPDTGNGTPTLSDMILGCTAGAIGIAMVLLMGFYLIRDCVQKRIEKKVPHPERRLSIYYVPDEMDKNHLDKANEGDAYIEEHEEEEGDDVDMTVELHDSMTQTNDKTSAATWNGKELNTGMANGGASSYISDNKKRAIVKWRDEEPEVEESTTQHTIDAETEINIGDRGTSSTDDDVNASSSHDARTEPDTDQQQLAGHFNEGFETKEEREDTIEEHIEMDAATTLHAEVVCSNENLHTNDSQNEDFLVESIKL